MKKPSAVMNTYSERKTAYLNACAAYRAACARHAERLQGSPGAWAYFSSTEAAENRRAIKKANAARERARRIFDAVATDEDKAAMLLDAIAEQAAFAQAMS